MGFIIVSIYKSYVKPLYRYFWFCLDALAHSLVLVALVLGMMEPAMQFNLLLTRDDHARLNALDA